jgi:hypothetical protein
MNNKVLGASPMTNKHDERERLQQAVSDLRKAAFEFALTKDLDDHDRMTQAQREIFAIYDTRPTPQADEVKRLEEVTRVEVIDINGRAYSNWNPGNKVELSFQDSGKTLKVFITNAALSHKEKAE